MNTNNFWKEHLLSIVLLVLPFVLVLFFWNQIPEIIPTHWNIDGEADSFGNKWSILILPFVNIGVFLLLWAIPKIDPKKSIEQFSKTYHIMIGILVGLLFLVFCIMLLTILGMIDNSTNWIMYSLIGLFLVIGNYLGKMRPNYFMGIRTPWTLENEEVWLKTHRFGGKLWVMASIVMLLLGFFAVGKTFVGLFVVYVLVIGIVPVVYSYLRYKELN
ncbi:MAG: SdpI family protein [Chitinophagales bacterium]